MLHAHLTLHLEGNCQRFIIAESTHPSLIEKMCCSQSMSVSTAMGCPES